MREALAELNSLELLITPTEASSFSSTKLNSGIYESLSDIPPLMGIQIPDSNISFRLEKEVLEYVDSVTSEPSSSVEPSQPVSPCFKLPPATTFKSLLAGDTADFLGSIGKAAVPKVDETLSMASFTSQASFGRSHEGLGTSIPAALSLDSSKIGHGHRFIIKEANGQETCTHCHQQLSEFLDSTYAMACEDCGFLCHKRCAAYTPLDCEAQSPAMKALASLFSSQLFFLNVENTPSATG
ncbi:hypothetical protein DSO57_1025485 [Entomophthora muscae]|uniref:Uncharacterized protein n=2 Tax=Entomophthora muscae TaxID=34485 RepID=A0ACC2TPH2_9FUNG|nr:hypothetical protein DSO57_1028151 [Entomophthora muscae]KAJ9076507.1 hypothetical protein DSO57_1025485 [Entomophthora muscae]